MYPLDKPTVEVTGDMDLDAFDGGSTGGLISKAYGLWWAIYAPTTATMKVEEPGAF